MSMLLSFHYDKIKTIYPVDLNFCHPSKADGLRKRYHRHLLQMENPSIFCEIFVFFFFLVELNLKFIILSFLPLLAPVARLHVFACCLHSAHTHTRISKNIIKPQLTQWNGIGHWQQMPRWLDSSAIRYGNYLSELASGCAESECGRGQIVFIHLN